MGNAEGFSKSETPHEPPPPLPSPRASPPSTPPLPPPPERPLRSILRPANGEPSGSEVEGRRRSVVFADQFSLDPPSSKCQPFLLGESVTHFGVEIVSTRPKQSGGDDSGVVLRRKKRAPPPPPPRRDSMGDAPAPEEVEDIRKKMRLDLQQSRAEYERLRNLRLPLRRREDSEFLADADMDTDTATVPFPQPLRSLAFKNDVDKNGPSESAATAELTKILTDFHIEVYDERSHGLSAARDPSWSCHSSDSGISNSLDEHSGYVIIEAAQPPPPKFVPPPSMPPPPPPRRFPQRNRPKSDVIPTFRVPPSPPRQSRNNRSETNEVPTYCVPQEIRPKKDVGPTFRVPAAPPRRSRNNRSETNVVPTYCVPQEICPVSDVNSALYVTPSRRSLRLIRSESDVVPPVRLPPSPSPAAPPPPAASSEPLFAFGDPVVPRRSSRNSMNDSFRRVRSSFGRFFGSIGRSVSLREKRRPVSVAFGAPAHDFYGQNRPLDAWTSVGSALDTALEAPRPSAHEALDDHLASVWHRVVRSSHEQLRASNPSLFGDDSRAPEVSPKGVLHMTHAMEGRHNLRTFQPPVTARTGTSDARF